MVVNATWGQLNMVYGFSLSAFAPENLLSQDGFDRSVPRQPPHPPHPGRILHCTWYRMHFTFGASFTYSCKTSLQQTLFRTLYLLFFFLLAPEI